MIYNKIYIHETMMSIIKNNIKINLYENVLTNGNLEMTLTLIHVIYTFYIDL